MSKAEMLRLLVKQRVHAASEETFGNLDRLTSQYEEIVSRLREHEIHRSDVQQLLEIKEDAPDECMDLDLEDPEPLHVKEDLEDLWTRLEGEQLEEDDLTKFLSTAVTVKSEDDKPQTSQLHQSQVEDNGEAEPPTHRPETPIQTETKGEDCGGSGPARNLNPHLNADDEKVSESSEAELMNGDWQKPLSDSGPESEGKDNVWCRKGSLKMHMRVHRRKTEKTFRCDVCGGAFRQQDALKLHMEVHTGEKPFGCDVCRKEFRRPHHLKRHMTVHTGEKLFSCDVCGGKFTQGGTLKIHMRGHTGEKPYGCDICGERFPIKKRLQTHMRIHAG